MLATARTIDIYGVENSFTPAVDLLTKLTYLGLNCRMHTDAYLQQISAAHLGIVDVDGGTIRYDGQDLTGTPMEKRGFNIVFQDYALFPNLNVYQNITCGLRSKPDIPIYGFWGLMVGYVIYTIPVAFLLIHNTMGFVDKKTLTVSKVMGDGPVATFWIAVLRPLLGTLAGAFIQAFFLCFTDFGIPASVGGGYKVIATLLYNQMLGGIPDFSRGAVIAMLMLVPSIGSICILQLLERFNIRYNRISDAELRRNRLQDAGWGVSGTAASLGILSIFAVIFVVPMVEEWPYKTDFSLEHVQAVFSDGSLLAAYAHSLIMAPQHAGCRI